MKRFLIIAVTLVGISIGLTAQVSNVDRIIYTPDLRTIASNGGGTAATLTLNPIGSYVAVACNDTDGCAVTMGESGIPDGMPVTIVNMSANAVTVADTSGVSELTGAASLGQYQTLTLIYRTDRWVEVSRSSGSGSGTVTTTGSPASGDLAVFSGAASITSGDLSGEVTTSGTTATTITNNAVTNAKLRDSGALSIIGRSANSSGDPADISASAASDCVFRESGSTVGCGTVTTAGLANDAVAFAKVQNASGASVLVGRGSASGAGDFQEIALGAGLTMAGTTISSTVVGTGGGDVVGPSSSTDEAVARFDSTTGKLLQNTSTLTLSDAGAFTFTDGVKQTFNPNGTNAGINVGSQAGDPGSPANGDLWYDSTANTLDARINGATVQLGSGSGLSTSVYLMYRDEKTQNTAGGTFTSGAWRTRDINTEVSDVGGLGSLSSNQITLTAGTYLIRAEAPAVAVNAHQLRLQNVTDATTVVIGTSGFSSAAVGVSSLSVVSGIFTIGASKALELQHQCGTTKATDGFGVQNNFTTEVYTVVELWKIG